LVVMFLFVFIFGAATLFFTVSPSVSGKATKTCNSRFKFTISGAKTKTTVLLNDLGRISAVVEKKAAGRRFQQIVNSVSPAFRVRKGTVFRVNQVFIQLKIFYGNT